MVLIWDGPTSQQPPTIVAPRSIHALLKTAYSDGPRSVRLRSCSRVFPGKKVKGMDRLGLKGAAAHRCEGVILLKSMK